VTQVIDGDTIVIDTGERIRFIGIDTPERGHCGYNEATANMRNMVYGKAVILTPGARDDVDKYGRLLRYVDLPDGTDTGLAQITGRFALARSDSRDGYATTTGKSSTSPRTPVPPPRVSPAPPRRLHLPPRSRHRPRLPAAAPLLRQLRRRPSRPCRAAPRRRSGLPQGPRS
jgi:hypothetical protein